MGIGFEYNKVPPQDQEIEKAVIGGSIVDKRIMVEIADLEPEHFYNEAHVRIFRAVKDMFNAGKTIDMLTVSQELKARGELENVGGAYYISQLSGMVGSGAHTQEHAKIIKSLWIKRKLIEILHSSSVELYQDKLNGYDIIDSLGAEIISLDNTTMSNHISEVSKKNAEYVEAVRSGEIINTGIPTGLNDIDKMITGLQSPDLVVIAGRPGMGKTAFALSILSNICVDKKIPGVFFSLEMNADQLDFRLESMHSGIRYKDLKKGNVTALDMRRYDEARKKISESGIYIDDDVDLTPERIRTKALRLKMQHDIQIVFVDYIQLMEVSGRTHSREGEISKISRSLKKLAKELDVPVVALSQLNRDVEKSNPPEPKMSHLRESGAIEQDADIIMFLYRPEYYGIDTIQRGDDVMSTTDLCVVDIAKHRNGEIGKVPVMFKSSLMRFGDFGTENKIVEDLPF